MNDNNDFDTPFYSKNGPIRRWGVRMIHWDQNYKYQFITMHLCDALPAEIIMNYKIEQELWLKSHPQPWSAEEQKYHEVHFENFFEKFLDRGYGECYLKNTQCAEVLERCLWHCDEIDYYLIDYVVMPNHVHVLVLMMEKDLDDIVSDWKKFSANKINKILLRKGALWQKGGYWDVIIRDKLHLDEVRNYIWRNWLNGGVLKMPEERM